MMSKIISTVKINHRQRPHLYLEDTVQIYYTAEAESMWRRPMSSQHTYFPQQFSAQTQFLPSPDRLTVCEK